MKDKPRIPNPGYQINPKPQIQKSEIFLAVMSAIFLVISFPDFNFEFLAWIGLVPLFFAIEDKKPRQAFLISYLAGVIFFFGAIYWLVHVTLPGMVVVVLYLALYFGLFGLVISLCKFKTRGCGFLFFAPALWVALELARSHLFGGFGWSLLAHSQSYTLPVIQIADMTGAYGVSFIIVMANASVFITVKNFRKNDFAFPYSCISLTVFIVFLCVTYGVFRLNNIFTGEGLKVAVIQGNIPQAKKWDPGFREDILKKYESLTKEAALARVDLVIWPETSVPGYLESERDLLDRVKLLAKEIKTPILAGAPEEDTKHDDVCYNSAVLFANDGRILDRYDKIHLVPFGEYVPFRKVLSFVERFAPSPIGDFTAGELYTVFKFLIEKQSGDKSPAWRLLKKVKFSCLICFEDIFPDLTRQFVKRGAAFLVNITNDAWFGPTSAPYQHAQSSVFRAVENRVNVVRAANTGLSCFIDQKGRIVSAVGSDGKNLFVNGFSAHEITLTPTRTFYTMFGDVFAYACVIFSLVFLFIKKIRGHHG